MTCGLIKVSNSLPEWQAAKLTLFAPCFQTRHICTFLGLTDTVKSTINI